MAQFFTNFDEYPVGDVTTSGQTDWTPRISNGTSDYRILDGGDQDGKFLRINAAGTNGSRVLGFNPLNGVDDNIETLVKFWVFKSGNDGSTGRYGAAYTRYGGNSEASTIGYAVIFVPVSSVKSLALYEDSTGVVQYANYAWSMSTDYFIRTRLSGTLRQVKIWPASSPEPSSWTFQSNGGLPTIASTYSGVGTYMADSYLYVKQFSAGTNGDPAPMFVPKSLDYTANADIAPPIPTSTPMGVFGAGYGAPMGYGGMYGAGVIPAFTVEHKDYAANAFIEWQKTLDYQANALIVHEKSLAYTSNAFIDKQYNVDYAANAYLEWQLTLPYVANASIERIESLSYTANAEIESFYFTADVTYTANARIEKVEALDYAANAFIDWQNSLGYDSNAWIDHQYTVGYDANAFVEQQRQLDYSANAFIEHRTAIEYDANAFLEWQLSQQYSANAFIEHVVDLDYAANARIERQGEQVAYEANARIERIEGLSYAANASISNPVPDKKPQTWENADTREPTDWSADDKAPTTWSEGEERQPAEWEKANERQPQQWSDSNNKKPADWSPIYYD